MKNILKGGLRSLIPHRQVEDADDVLELLDEETDAGRNEAAVKRPVGRPRKADKVSRVNVVSADEEGETTDEQAAQLVRPEKPLVTPLTIDMEEKVETPPSVRREDKTAMTGGRGMWDKHEEQVHHIQIAAIAINRSQPRRMFGETEMAELTNSIAMHGILQPLVVRRLGGGFELIAGERRLRAAKSLGWDRVPCVVRRDVRGNASRLELALIENIQRKDLNPVEEAMAYRQLNEEYGMTHEEIGRRVGRSRVGITNAIRVLQLPEEVQQGLANGTISEGHAKAVLMIPDREKQVRFFQHMVAEGLTVRKAETRARRIQRTMELDDPLREKRKGRSRFEIKYSGLLEDRYGFDARVQFVGQRNRFEITFRSYSQEEVEELIGRLLGTRPLPKKLD
ncbi:MAG: ParB/RepB/Spo0J family partition protein [Candidatus Andersenbacteria bacterium]|nr:ParB/RepB/Spo0J family partition protein [Candidatus Andersenbacteria bacterium]